MRIDWLMLVLSLVLGAGCRQKQPETPPVAPRPDRLLGYHFVGRDQIAADTNATRLKEVWSLPESQELKQQTLQKLAKTPYAFYQQRISSTTNDFAALLQPLLEDLLAAESFAEARDVTNQPPEWVLAVRLTDEQAQAWHTNLSTVLTAWTGEKAKAIEAEKFAGWELKKHDAPNLFRLIRAGQWTVLGLGQDNLPLQEEILARIRSSGRPAAAETNSWLTAWADWPRLSRWVSLPASIQLPQTRLAIVGKAENVRTEIELVYPEKVNWSFEPWQIPTNAIREPLISFTAGRGIASWLSRQQMIRQFEIEPAPNQFFFWALAQIPFQSFAAFPISNPTNLLEQVVPWVTAVAQTNLPQYAAGTIQWSTNIHGLVWQGLPFIAPYLQPMREETGEFVLAGLFPNNPRKTPFPEELLAQLVNRTNLVYYDWEITEERLSQWHQLAQLYRLIVSQPQLKTNSASLRWMQRAGPKLGNTVTELTLTAPNELQLVRKSPISFTGLELVLLTDWLESPGFPLGGSRLLTERQAFTNRPPRTTPHQSRAETGR